MKPKAMFFLHVSFLLLLGTASIGFTQSPPPPPPASFAAPVPYTVGGSPYSPVVADFNGDGKLDLAVANSGDGTVSVLLGNGDGTFQAAAPPYTVGTTPVSIAVGDFNHDGCPDLAVANLNSSNVSVLLNKCDGSGTFNAAVPYTITGSAPRSIAAGDFNHDGYPDLAVADNNGSVWVLLNDGTASPGTFGTPVSYTLGGTPFSVAVGDFNADGYPDLAVANDSIPGYVSVLLNVGGDTPGTFQEATNYSVGAAPYWVTVGDFNGDGYLDLAVANEADGTVSVLLNNPADPGQFLPMNTYSANSEPFSVTVGDFNGDGKLDLVVSNDASSAVSVLLGNGDGSFQPPATYAAGTSPDSIAVGDFNGDGKPDMAVANDIYPAPATVSVLLNTSPYALSTVQNQPSQLTYNFGPYNFVVNYYGDSAYTGLSLAAAPLSMTPGQFSTNRLTGTNYAGATCSIFNGTGGKCVVFELTCQNTATRVTVTCPTPTSTSPYTFTINWDTTDNTSGWSITNTALLEAPVGTNSWDDIQTFFSPTRTDDPDPTTTGRTGPGYSDFVFVYNVTTTGTPPTITITSPQSGAVYAVGENVLAEYSCTGSSVASCVGNVPSASPIDTSCAVSSCNKTFTVNATVNSPPPATPQTVNYQVSSTVSTDTTSINAPTITYGAAANVTVSVTSAAGTVPGNVSLTVDSGSPLTQALSGGSAVFTISGLAGGSHSLSASYAAQGAFDANSATGTLVVNPASQTIAVTTAAPSTANDGTTFTVAATASSGLPVTITTSGACSGSSTTGSATVTMTSGTGTCTVNFTQAGNANYSLATEVTNSTTATAGPVASVSPSTGINFGTVYLGTITTKNVTVTNQGDAPMTITDPLLSIVSGGNWFVAVNLCPKSLAVGKSCTISVSFVAGPFYTLQTATLNVMDNAPGSPQKVALTATVMNPRATFSSSSLNFGNQTVGTASAAETVKLTNTGTTPLVLSTLTVSGNFALVPATAPATTCANGETLTPSASCTIAVTFTPTAKGVQSGSVVITDNAQNSPQRILLSGTGK
jgi:hypothetical protein